MDIVHERLELAKTLGATHVINGKDADVVEQIKSLTAYHAGTSFVLEATGNVGVLKMAHAALANRGHLVRCVVGVRGWERGADVGFWGTAAGRRGLGI